MQRATQRIWYSTFRVVGIVGIVGAAFTAAALKTSPTDPWFKWPLVSHFISLAQNNGWWLIGVFTFAASAWKGGQKFIGDPWAAEAVDKVLLQLRDQVIQKLYGNDDPMHYHRATLFKRVAWCFWPSPARGLWPWGRGNWPWSGWLISVGRSGHTTNTHRITFLASEKRADDNDGVAGRTWTKGRGTVFLKDLPEVLANSSDKVLKDYAKKTWMTEPQVKQYLKNGKVLARSFWGITIEMQGKNWGVVVVDSRRPDGIDSSMTTATSQMVAILSNLAKRV
jgi:hypothetical protein